MPLFDSQREPIKNMCTVVGRSRTPISRLHSARDGLFKDSLAADPKPVAILLSHAHLDHVGLISHTDPSIPIYASRGTSKMMLAGSLFAGQTAMPRERFRELESENPVIVGPFRITPFAVDHSIYAGLAFLIEADGSGSFIRATYGFMVASQVCIAPS